MMIVEKPEYFWFIEGVSKLKRAHPFSVSEGQTVKHSKKKRRIQERIKRKVLDERETTKLDALRKATEENEQKKQPKTEKKEITGDEGNKENEENEEKRGKGKEEK